MDVTQSAQKIYRMADTFGAQADARLNKPGGVDPVDMALLQHDVTMMSAYWQLASSLMKELSEPLKAIVNK